MKGKRPRLILAIDYDQTLADSGWPDPGTLKKGAKKWCEWAQWRGHRLILWTCREGEDLDKALDYLNSQGLCFDLVNCNDPERVAFFKSDTRKVGCEWLFDDKAGFMGWWSFPIIVRWLEWKYKNTKWMWAKEDSSK